MKKMHLFMVMLLTAIIPVLFNSCNPSKPDDYAELIIGEWEMTRMDYEVEYDSETEVGSDYLDEGDWIWNFDGNRLTMIYDNYNDDDAYRYDIEDNKLYTEYASNYNVQYFKIITLNTTKLVLELTYQYEDINTKYTYVFKRI